MMVILQILMCMVCISPGPIQDLRSMLFRYMQPWKPTKVLHIGLTDPSTRDLEAKWWGKPKPKKPNTPASMTAGAAGGKSISEVDVGSNGDAARIYEAPVSNNEAQVRNTCL
jgi:hypothetical protein